MVEWILSQVNKILPLADNKACMKVLTHPELDAKGTCLIVHNAQFNLENSTVTIEESLSVCLKRGDWFGLRGDYSSIN